MHIILFLELWKTDDADDGKLTPDLWQVWFGKQSKKIFQEHYARTFYIVKETTYHISWSSQYTGNTLDINYCLVLMLLSVLFSLLFWDCFKEHSRIVTKRLNFPSMFHPDTLGSCRTSFTQFYKSLVH